MIGLVELRTGTTQELYIVQSVKINHGIHPYIALERLATVQHLLFRMKLSPLTHVPGIRHPECNRQQSIVLTLKNILLIRHIYQIRIKF